MRDPSGHMRFVIVRYPKERESTAQTRKEGLELIGSFFMDPKFSKFPPVAIEKIDQTDEDDPCPLDTFFKDEDIEEFMRTDVAEKELDSDFVEKYSDFAKLCWSGNHYSDFAVAWDLDRFPPFHNSRRIVSPEIVLWILLIVKEAD